MLNFEKFRYVWLPVGAFGQHGAYGWEEMLTICSEEDDDDQKLSHGWEEMLTICSEDDDDDQKLLYTV